MTDEEASIILGNLPVNGDGCYSITEYQQAKAMAIKALDENEKLKEAVGKIKEEIQEQRRQYYTYGLNINPDKILQIIDKHTEELI